MLIDSLRWQVGICSCNKFDEHAGVKCWFQRPHKSKRSSLVVSPGRPHERRNWLVSFCLSMKPVHINFAAILYLLLWSYPLKKLANFWTLDPKLCAVATFLSLKMLIAQQLWRFLLRVFCGHHLAVLGSQVIGKCAHNHTSLHGNQRSQTSGGADNNCQSYSHAVTGISGSPADLSSGDWRCAAVILLRSWSLLVAT